MFEPTDRPRLFGLPCGSDFPTALARGLTDRMSGRAPEAMADVELFVNTTRMRRRVAEAFAHGAASFVPRIRLVTDLTDAPLSGVPPAAPPLRRRLELVQFISALIDKDETLAPRAAIFDLADSLAALLSEMHDEGVPPAVLHTLDVPDTSGHWKRSLAFLQIVERYFDVNGDHAPSAEARLRQVIEQRIAEWVEQPPDHPILIAGSTGSRGTTALLMRAVARLPQGALVLPGYDFDLPEAVWDGMIDGASPVDDHPQYRYARLLRQMSAGPHDVDRWLAIDPPNPARNRLVSLAMRPAPVTDQWLAEGPAFAGLVDATDDMVLIEAASPRHEATAIALVLREAVEKGQTAALITPDRGLTRQVTAALSRWGIEPDDSAGAPLAQSAPGRLMRHVAALPGQRLTAEAIIVLLKHPLIAAGSDERGDHLRFTRDLELWMRRRGPAFPDHDALADWAAAHASRHQEGPARAEWVDWIAGLICGLDHASDQPLAAHLHQHITRCEALVAGRNGDPAELWRKPAGARAAETVTMLRNEAEHGGVLSATDYADLILAILARGEVRDPVRPHPNVMIWGTLEARTQGADLTILGGLNDGVWPAMPPPDPWLNRDMRLKCGLVAPEQRVGLAAHDFQQAIGAPRVILTRAIRDAEAQTIPSRWLNRLTNLLAGMSQDGKGALEAMRARGAVWVDRAQLLDAPDVRMPPAPRPSPRPPVEARPHQLSVTRVEVLIRDPYAIYAEYVLRLSPLDPLRRSPDAPLRGTVAHAIFERFIRETDLTHERLTQIADEVLLAEAPWPATRRLWRARIARIADWFIAGEAQRRLIAEPFVLEKRGQMVFPDVDFTLTARADRIDQMPDGKLVIYDYKTGKPPTPKQMARFNKQLLLEAVLAERGGFVDVPKSPVGAVSYIGLGSNPELVWHELEPGEIAQVEQELTDLVASFNDRARGYTALRVIEQERFERPYDHLARFGEWDRTAQPVGEDVE